MRFPTQPGSTDMALAGLLSAQTEPAAYAQRAFAAYWEDNRDLNDEALIRDLLAASGHDPESFDAAARLTELEAMQLASEELGVVDTPAYVIDGQVFIGREHLPWVRELLQG